ncbi:hypothetical protein AT727_11940 [Desulfitobacterium hafniense]|uniref:Uncharacterized protein n=2 Tax=Desulfitobacterium hafniense TaxID=49338 RepID=A0A0W1JDS2_DESHA|nr:hypothetical protein AT727_11940 [Desulfitobacterium hafniense]
MQSIAQKYTTPEHTGLLYALEPVFSALFAFCLFAGSAGNQGLHGSVDGAVRYSYSQCQIAGGGGGKIRSKR